MTKKTTKTSARKKAGSSKKATTKTTAKKPAQKKDSNLYICTSDGLVVGKMKKVK